MDKESEDSQPPSCRYRFIVGRDARGRWVVCDRSGSVGGIFVDRSSAFHFARRESGYSPGAVFCDVEAPELDFFAMLGPASRPAPKVQPKMILRAA